MIETVLLNYLNNANLSAKVYMEQPKEKPTVFFVLEKSGSDQTNHINESNFIIQSNAESLASAASMNEEIKAAMFNAITLDDISRVELNGDYNYTDPTTKQYRYQSVFVITHY